MAQIGFDNLGVMSDLVGGALGDDFAIVQHINFVTDSHDDFHIVLDEENSDSGVGDAADEVEEVLGFGGVHTCSGFIEQEQGGCGGEGPGNFESTLEAVGEGSGFTVDVIAKSAPLETGTGGGIDHGLFLAGPGERKSLAEGGGFGAVVESDFDIIETAEIGEKADVLEGAGDAHASDLIGSEVLDGSSGLLGIGLKCDGA